MEQNNPQPQPGSQIQLKVADEVLKGAFSNQALIRHTAQEFIMDFVNFVPGDPHASLVSRVVLTPQHAKSFLAALQANLKGYEDKFGKVQAPSGPESPNNFGFRTA